MKSTYIVPSQLLLDSPPRDSWEAMPIPSDPTQSVLRVNWDNTNWEQEFEALPGVLHLGLPWEPIPGEAATLLASFQQKEITATTMASSAPTVDQAPISVARALRGIGWR